MNDDDDETIFPDLIDPTTRFEPSLLKAVEAYSMWLSVIAPQHKVSFEKRLKEDAEAAHAEAVVFTILRQKNLHPKPGEVIGQQGGVDFICTPKGHPKFAVEVTAIRTETVTKASGLPHPASLAEFRGFSQITGHLMREAVSKATQLADYPMPRVLVIATRHDEAALLMNARSAAELLVGTTAINVPLGKTDMPAHVVATLKHSVFFREKNGIVEPARQSISAIILIGFSESSASAIGLLHPAPAVTFDHNTFSDVHFVRLAEWPVDQKLKVEWVGPTPRTTSFSLFPARLTDDELKGKA